MMLLLSLVALLHLSDTRAEVAPTKEGIDVGKELLQWVRSNDKAFFHDNLTITRRNESDPLSPYSIFATEVIPANDLLFKIPPDMILHAEEPTLGDRIEVYISDEETLGAIITNVHSNGTYEAVYDNGTLDFHELDYFDHQSDPVNCGTVRRLIREVNAGADSQFAPYINLLMDVPQGPLPFSWSEAGQDLLRLLVGEQTESNAVVPSIESDEDDTLTQDLLPPRDAFGVLEDDWYGRCKGGSDPLSIQAYTLLYQRGLNMEILIPVFDMLRHRNGWVNTVVGRIREQEPVEVRSARVIEAGDELYRSHNVCETCEEKALPTGTPELLRDFGFVEEYPQRWIFHDQAVSFDLEEAYDSDGSPTGELKLSWVGGPPLPNSVKFFRTQFQRLQDLAETEFETRDPSVPVHEWDLISRYHKAMLAALTHAIRTSPMSDAGECSDEQTCGHVLDDRYGLLEAKDEIWPDGRPHTCGSTGVTFDKDWEEIEDISSIYQNIEFLSNPIVSDVCFHLDNVVQICSSYRPHYHELMVDYSAGFIDDVKRILFVGGGDSMLLHEALKYPSLEKVVGLELDQHVTRSSFKYFGTQPHWDNEKVEWWFGDATKSLLMLPKDYFGSFDMVLVDLSETVVALSVTDELDVMTALGLLVKPAGILAKNEYLYFLGQAEFFKHTLHAHIYDAPMVCSQSLILASNGVDFMRGKYIDHNVDHLLGFFDEPDHRYEIVRDFQTNETAQQNFCKTSHPHQLKETQTRSPGILMIVDAEKTALTLNDVKALEAKLVEALERTGLSIVKTVDFIAEGEGALLSVILKEGYILARAWPDHNACALDIHLWSAFDKHDAVKRALSEALGSTIVSAYRIVAGGMFGVNTWQNDVAKLGPHVNELCTEKEYVTGSTRFQTADPRDLEAALTGAIDLIDEKAFKVAVLCPGQGKTCETIDALKEKSHVGEVLILQACDDLVEGIEYSKNASDRIFACEKKIWKTLKQSSSSTKIRAVVLDRNAPFALGQIVLKLFKTPIYTKQWLAPNITVAAPIVNGKETWRRVFVDAFRKDIFPEEPVFTASISFNDSKSRFEMVVTHSGDGLFAKNLVVMAERIEAKTGVTAGITSIRAGGFRYQDDFSPRQFTHLDYDQNSAKKQWHSQTPLGLQTVLQLEQNPDSGNRLTASQVQLATKQALASIDVDASECELFQWDLADGAKEGTGDGCIVVALWSKGTVAVAWDGRIHVDVNLFTYEEDFESPDTFISQFSGMKTVLRDEQPRGTGRVVNFRHELMSSDGAFWLS